MSKADGEQIKITFDQPLTAIGASDYEHFQIAFQVPDYVPGGALENATRTPYAVQNAPTVHATIDLSAGSFSGLTYADGVLHLAEAAGEA